MELPLNTAPIVELPIKKEVRLFLKREDQIDPEISGNKFWKLFYPIKTLLENETKKPVIYTFGGAYSNHIAAISAMGKRFGFATHGIVRGEELKDSWMQNPTLRFAHQNGMEFSFVSREVYREKGQIVQLVKALAKDAILIPEGGTSELAVEGFKYVLGVETQSFDYICAPVGTGGTLAGLSKFAGPNQKILGFKVVKDGSLDAIISRLSGRENFELIEAAEAGYGKMSVELIEFVNAFSSQFSVAIDPLYMGKMMQSLLGLIEKDYFPKGTRILAIHTGGLQGIAGANEFLQSKGRVLIQPVEN
ncbi:1-aminocyclopropane-1-carboxylate deaminase/D-cysteine desulfhydrase [Chryseobacterium sp. A321]